MASISTPAPSGRAATPKAARAGRVFAGEVAGVDLVDGGEVGDVGEQDRGLDDVVVPEPGLGQDGAHVLEDLLGLGLDVALDERAGGRVERHLPGDEDERAGTLTGGDALGVRADGGGGVGRGDTADGHGFLVPAGRWGSAASPASGAAARVTAQWRRRPGQTTHAPRTSRFSGSAPGNRNGFAVGIRRRVRREPVDNGPSDRGLRVPAENWGLTSVIRLRSQSSLQKYVHYRLARPAATVGSPRPTELSNT